MSKSSTTVQINALVERVFTAITDIESFPRRAESITKVEFLSDVKNGVGTKFRETRMMGSKEATAVLEITEFVENEKVRFVSDEGGTIWDTVFTVNPSGSETRMDVEMDARPYKFFSKIVTPLMIGLIGKYVKKDMEELKAWCERTG
jgi:uncharacterized membrane protein